MIYVIRDPQTERVKIGFSEKPWARLGQIQIGCPTDLTLAAVMDGGRDDEAALHARFSEYHVRGEWFAETAELADFVSRMPPPHPKTARSFREPKTPLDAWMIANGVRSEDLAGRIGIGAPFMSQLRNGLRQPSLEVAALLVELTGLSAGDFLISAINVEWSAA
ncbi:MAG: hypothetical protein JWQ97_3544 [Phenylobacterium sp.]|nr:hypothetical protein [Phenylobacterium sp.]